MIKVNIFSGFLGAGKTTLISKLIKECFKNEKVVLIENEFGEIGIDGGFLKESGILINEINSGCICCSLQGDFEASLKKVIETYTPTRIIIEPSGVGQLSDIIKLVEKFDNLQIESTVTIVDTLKAHIYAKNFKVFFDDQVQNASCIVLSKTTQASLEALKNTVAIIKHLNDNASIITTQWDQLSGETLLQAMVQAYENRMTCDCGCHQHSPEACECHQTHTEDSCDCGCHEHDEAHCECHEHDACDCGCHQHSPEACECHQTHTEDSCDCGCHKHDEAHCECHEHDACDCGCHQHSPEACECHQTHTEDSCDCGCHDHDEAHCDCHEHDACGCGHHHHHDASHHFISLGYQTVNRYTQQQLHDILSQLDHHVIRAKGMVQTPDANWLFFDFVSGEIDIREGQPQITGLITVIGDTSMNKELIEKLFEVA